MESGIILLFISNHLKSVERQLCRFEDDRKIERLHRIRVDLKKTRAILSFIEKIYRQKIESDALKLLFRKAGEIRQFQITTELLASLLPPPQLIILNLKKKQDDLTDKFIKDIPQYLQTVQSFHKNTFLNFSFPNQNLTTKYINRGRKKATKSFKCHRRSKMHSFRKLIKKILYVYEILPKKLKRVLEINLRLINKVQNDVGQWHDTYSAIDFLLQNNANRKADFISSLNQSEAKQFENLFVNYNHLKI